MGNAVLDSTTTIIDDVSTLHFRRINAFIVELYQAAHEVPASQFKEWAFDRMQPLVAFDSGLWAQATMEYGLQVHGQYAHKQPKEMMRNYEAIKHEDPLIHRLIELPGTTWDLYSVCPRDEWIKRIEYTEHCRKFGIEAVISTALLDRDTRLLTVISLYRANPDQLFSETDRITKELLTPHLVEAYRICLFLHLHLPAGFCNSNLHAAALCDRMGVIHQSEAAFADLLRREWPDWVGPLLPDDIVRLFRDGEDRSEGKQVDIQISPLDDLYHVCLCPHSPLRALAPRERSVAELLSEGLSYKEIAQRLEISPSTVTNHVNAIYQKLKINGRGKLNGLLRAHDVNGSKNQ